jgi:hypothetical protein
MRRYTTNTEDEHWTNAETANGADAVTLGRPITLGLNAPVPSLRAEFAEDLTVSD